jgi:hypothetical protein
MGGSLRITTKFNKYAIAESKGIDMLKIIEDDLIRQMKNLGYHKYEVIRHDDSIVVQSCTGTRIFSEVDPLGEEIWED